MNVRFSGSVILRMVYGYDVKVKHESYIALAEEATNQLIEAATPGKYYVDFMPFLKHVPSWSLFKLLPIHFTELRSAWFPGAGFKRKAREWAKNTTSLIETPWEMLMPKIVCPSILPFWNP